MGDVYRAEDLRLRRIVALKMLRTRPGIEDGTERLLAEARAASALSHPHIAVVYEIGHANHAGEPLAYIAMEYVEGTTLGELARGRRLDLDVVLDIFEQIADALAEAQRLGVVHCDLKPANVMIAVSGRVKVLDFGVAERRRPVVTADDSTRTADRSDRSSGFAGTVGYAAPEQLAGRAVDTRADFFSLGVSCMSSCGERPFRATTPRRCSRRSSRAMCRRFPIRIAIRGCRRWSDSSAASWRAIATIVPRRRPIFAGRSSRFARGDVRRPRNTPTLFRSSRSPASRTSPGIRKTSGWEPASPRRSRWTRRRSSRCRWCHASASTRRSGRCASRPANRTSVCICAPRGPSARDGWSTAAFSDRSTRSA